MLPYTHVTDIYAFRDVIASGELSPSPCRIFGSELLYMFYGRPAYRAVQQEASNGMDACWPVCFVMNPSTVKPIRVFPFDSGAFHIGLYAGHMDRRMIKEDFEVEKDPASAQRIVNLFWRNERSYFDADNRKGLKDIDPAALDLEFKAYRDLIASTGNADYDERNSAIEAQLDSPVPLKGNTIAVILPSDFAERQTIQRIEDMGALCLPFSTVQRHTAANMVSHIYNIVRDLFSGHQGRVQYW